MARQSAPSAGGKPPHPMFVYAHRAALQAILQHADEFAAEMAHYHCVLVDARGPGPAPGAIARALPAFENAIHVFNGHVIHAARAASHGEPE